MKNRQKRLSLVLGTLMLVGVSTGAFAYYNVPHDVSTTTKTETTATGQLVTQKNEALVRSINRSLETDTDKLLQAIGILAKQTSLSTQEMAQADLKAKIDASSIQQGIAVGEEITKAHLDYGGSTGQGYNPCHVMTDSMKAVKALDSAKINTIDVGRQSNTVGGKLSDTSFKQHVAKVKEHRAKYCSQSDVDNKTCEQVSELANADVNASSLTMSSISGSDMDEAKTAFRNNVMGEPDRAVGGGDTDVSRAYLLQTNQRQARLAPADYSMAYLQAMTTVDENLLDNDGKPMSPDEKIQATVNRYYGSDESKEWLKSMMAQQPRGLLVEQTKMMGLESHLHVSNIQSKERQLMMLASLVATSYEKMDRDMQKQLLFIRRNS